MSHSISNFDDVIDSRDVIARIEELEEMKQSLVDAITELHEERNEDSDEEAVEALKEIEIFERDLEAWDESEEGEELKILKALAEEGEGSPDWEYGEVLIRDSYFKEYAQELAEDCDMIPSGIRWPCTCIDWEQAAEELQQDYFRIDFGGVDYWISS
jgi:hypothetical protein